MSLNIDPASWVELNRLLDQALDLPQAQRAAWLDSLDERYSALKPKLTELLSRAGGVETRDFLGTLPKVDSTTGARVNDIVGPYRLLREIGQGGMGSVWLAERIDGLVNRPVALKLPHSAWRFAGLAERMTREREILATLNHPNIATLYDAGITPDGQPYLALEHVEGKPIDTYCAEQALDIRSKLKLFVQVANAVAHAHAKLVVHRDLKPSNILVSANGHVRLLDFGIAKLLDDGKSQPIQLTELTGRAMTPDFASPEQILGAPITIASDIYSLGVIFYQLLTGVRPYQLKRDTRGALEDAILTAEPRRPSDAVSRGDAKLLRGDLDTIVLKALKKRPAERYATVNELVDDVFRFLDRKPVLAQPDSEWYRMRKFAARHALALGLVSAIVLTILIGAAVATWQMLEANRQRDAALLHQRRAEAFSQFMGVLLNDVSAGGQLLTPAALLDRGVAMLERQTALDPAVAAFMWYELSRSYRFFFQTQRERAMLTRSADIAQRIGDANLFAASECAASWSLLESARAVAEEKIGEALAALRASPVQADYATMECLRAESRLLHARGDIQGAIALIENGMTKLSGNPRGKWYYAAVRDQLAGLHRAAGNNVAALEISADQLVMLREMGRQGSGIEVLMLSGYARDLCRVGEYVACTALQEQVVEMLDKPGAAMLALPGGRGRAGIAMLTMGRPDRALQLAEQDLAISKASGNLAVIAQAHWVAASALLALKQVDAAEQRIAAAEAIWNTSPGTFGAYINEGPLLRAEIALTSGDIARAKRGVDALLSQANYPQSLSAPRLDAYLQVAARVALQNDDAESAATMAEHAVQIARRNARGNESSGDVGLSALWQAKALVKLRRDAQAKAVLQQAIAALSNGLGASHWATLEAKSLYDPMTRH